MEENKTIIFGPVPSRRLGRSLGINNIPPKICTYSCIYCQLGPTLKMQLERQEFYNPKEILDAVKNKIEETKKSKETIDYLSFVPDGEPTLDINLGHEINLLKPLGIPIAVITNSSLIWQEEVRKDLMGADWVSLKIDAVEDAVWHRIDRPHRKLNLSSILDGALEFTNSFKGKLVTETMLVKNTNDNEEHIEQVANFLARLKPSIAYLSIPTRPPAEEWVLPPDEIVINRAYQIINEKVEHVEYLIDYEGDAFAFTGNVEEDLLSITSVHPMRQDAVDIFLKRSGADWAVVYHLIEQKKLIETEHRGHKFYIRRFRKNTREKNKRSTTEESTHLEEF